jgi:hypothetical protein
MKARLQIVNRRPPEMLSLERLALMRPQELQQIHKELFNAALPSTNSEQLRRRIAYRLQEQKEGGLPASARQHALAIAGHVSSRMRIRAKATGTDPLPHSTVTALVSDHDPRLPMPGTVIVKEHRGRTIIVHALDEGFEYDGHRFSSLSAIAREVTGTKWNGFAFFGMAKGRVRGR